MLLTVNLGKHGGGHDVVHDGLQQFNLEIRRRAGRCQGRGAGGPPSASLLGRATSQLENC